MLTSFHASIDVHVCIHTEESGSCPVGLVNVGFHARPFVPHCIPLFWINALLLSQHNEQAEAAKRGLLDLQRHKSIERY